MRINVAIAVAEEARDRVYEVAEVCRALGFAHASTLSNIGILIGSAEVEDLPILRAIPGVLAVETERALRIAALQERATNARRSAGVQLEGVRLRGSRVARERRDAQ